MQNIFISYSRKDLEFALRIAELVDAAGAQLWLDVKDIPAGKNWNTEIDEGLRGADLMLLIVTADALQSPAVDREVRSFLADGKPIIPLRAAVVPLPPHLSSLQWVDFAERPFDAAYDQLVHELNGYGLRMMPARSYLITPKPETPAPTSHAPREINWTKWSVIAALIVGLLTIVATIGAPVLDFLLNRAAVESAAPTLSVSDPTASPRSVVQAITPTAGEATAPVSGGIPHFHLIFGSENSLTLVFTADSNISDLLLSTRLADVRPPEDFDRFALLGMTAPEGLCLRYELTGSTDPIPRSCREPDTITLAPADVFWYDAVQNRLLDVVVMNGADTLRVCAASNPNCEVNPT